MLLVRNGSKPKVWFTGSMNEPILMVFETPWSSAQGSDYGNSLKIIQYPNFEMMKMNFSSKMLEVPRTYSSTNEGSPSWEFVDFSGDIETSKFGLRYEMSS